MNTYYLKALSQDEIARLCKRPAIDHREILSTVNQIIEEVARDGDRAVQFYSRKFDCSDRRSLAISEAEKKDGIASVSDAFKSAIMLSKKNITAFHKGQFPSPLTVETVPGVVCRREWRPIERIGLYVPGGSAPLVSSVLMLGIPARIAGCGEIILCTPPSKTGAVSAEILFAAEFLDITSVFAVGGAQAIAAMACGTDSIPKVDKIFGPGNRFVASAKALVQQQPYNVAIDMLAGPTELLVVADETANPRWVAADLLSQAEHGTDSQVVLVATSDEIARKIHSEMERRRISFPRNATITKALDGSFTLIVDSAKEGVDFSNLYAPEHLGLAVKDAEQVASQVTSAGSVFIGHLCSVVFGDYISGTNHTLPTNATARSTGGITVESFMKPVFFQTINRIGYSAIAERTTTIALAEGLEAHANAVRVRGENDD